MIRNKSLNMIRIDAIIVRPPIVGLLCPWI